MNTNLLKEIFAFVNFEDHFNINLVDKKFNYTSDNIINNKWEKLTFNKFSADNIYR